MTYPQHLVRLIQLLRKLPGVGTRTAERFAFDMLTWPHNKRKELADAIALIPEGLPYCPRCHCLINHMAPCSFCDAAVRDTDMLCIVAATRDVFAIEETRKYNGLYHVLGQLLSPLDGMESAPPDLSLIKKRIASLALREIILAFDNTLEGGATTLYLQQELAHFAVPITCLSFELPVGSAFEYLDGVTLVNAIVDRA